MKKQIEIEFRARLDEKKYKELEVFLNKKAEDLGTDDKDVFFFIMPDKLLKVVNNISKKKAEIVLKMNKIGKGSDFEEITIPISQKDFDSAVNTFTKLDITDNIMHSFQKRRNYLYKDVEIALKYSDVWGYHLELEKVVNSLDQKKTAENSIRKIAKELNVYLMTDQELFAFTQKAEKKYKLSNKT